VTGPPSPLDEHEVQTGEVNGVGFARCACGKWEAYVSGPRSARWAFEEYTEHLRRVGAARADGHPRG
jgi:hypothetical protein